jgi:hypothetical protein
MLKETGRRPTQLDKIIKHGPLADGKRTWTSINSAFIEESHGLKDCGFKSLAQFLDSRNINTPQKTLSLDGIAASAEAMLKETGRRPTQLDKIITHGPVADGKCSWKSVDNAFVLESHGLNGCGFKSLAQFLDSRGIVNVEKGQKNKIDVVLSDIPTGTLNLVFELEASIHPKPDKASMAKDILKSAALYVLHGKEIPTASKNPDLILNGTGKSISELNKTFRESAIEGWEKHMSAPAPRHLTDFLLATGVAIEQGRKIIPAPAPVLIAILKTLG